MSQEIALITIATTVDGQPVVTSSGLTKATALKIAHVMSSIQASLMDIAMGADAEAKAGDQANGDGVSKEPTA